MNKIIDINISKRKQQGMSTLVISMALLIMTTMAIIFSANTGIMERKIAANDFRASQALLSAQAGIDLALSNISTYGLSSPVAPYKADGSNIITDGDQAITYNDGTTNKTTGYYNISIDTTKADYPDKITIVSEGKSNDLTASAKVSQKLVFAPVMRGDARNYLNKAIVIVNGDVEIDEAKIDNIDADDNTYFSSHKIWASNKINNSDETTDSIILPGSSSVTYDNVAPLNRLFLSSMRDPANTGTNTDQGIKHISTRSKCDTATCSNPTALLTASKPESKIHYLEGNNTIDGLTIGSSSYPVVMVVDLTNGDKLLLKNDTTIFGLLLIKGDWDNKGKSAVINGAIVVENGDLLNGNNLTVQYSKDVYDNLGQVGIYTRIPGSWSDIN